VRDILLAARQYHVNLHIVSRGLNWGYGSKIPFRNGSVVVELSLLNRIISYDPVLGLISVEPGVTFDQVAAFLLEKNDRHFISVPGSSPMSSVVGNTLQRGVGLGPKSLRWRHVTGLSVLLPGGELIRLGLRGGDHSSLPYSLDEPGPSLFGLWLQSPLGVVVTMTLELAIHQKFERIYQLHSSNGLNNLLQITRSIMENLSLKTNVVVSSPTRLSQHDPNTSASRLTWRARFATYSPNATVDTAYFQTVADAVATLPSIQLTTNLCDRTDLRVRNDSSLDRLNGRFVGIPNDLGHYSLYSNILSYEQFNATSTDPNLDGIGLIWIDPLVPNDPDQISDFVEELTEIFSKVGRSADLAINLLDTVVACITIAIRFDRKKSQDEVIVQELHQNIHSVLKAHGYTSNRHIHLDDLESSSLDRRQIFEHLRAALDPEKIIDDRPW
jgi:4-cresol dehydrogenase (hydroxylating)